MNNITIEKTNAILVSLINQVNESKDAKKISRSGLKSSMDIAVLCPYKIENIILKNFNYYF